MQKFEVREINCWYCGKRGHVKGNCWFLEKAKTQPKYEDTNSIIEDFLANLDSVEGKIVQEKVKTKCHFHWWDNWKKEETSAKEEEGLKYSLFEDFLDSIEEEDIEEEDGEVSEDEVDEVETKTQEDYEKEKVMRLKEENLLITDKLICMDQKLMVLCCILNIGKDNFEKEWDFSKVTVFQQE